VNPLVSINCLTYNAEKFLRDTLDGFLIQKTNFPYEILVHDDASIDKTVSILQEYEKDYPEIFNIVYRETNIFSKTGVYPFFENIKRAKGKYIADCDGEDFWTDPYKLQKQVDFLEGNRQYSLCHHKYILRTPQGDLIPTPESPKDFSASELIDFNLSGHGIGLRTRMYRNVYNSETEKDIKRMAGDYSWNVYLGLYGGCKYLPDILPAVYRYGWGNNSWADLPKDIEQEKIKKMMKDILNWFIEKKLTKHIETRKKYAINPFFIVKKTVPEPPIVRRGAVRRPTIARGRTLPPNWR